MKNAQAKNQAKDSFAGTPESFRSSGFLMVANKPYC
jgi:hypothetical protein